MINKKKRAASAPSRSRFEAFGEYCEGLDYLSRHRPKYLPFALALLRQKFGIALNGREWGNSHGGDTADQAFREQEDEVEQGVNQIRASEVAEVATAIDAIKTHTFHQCWVCKFDIPLRRKEARPHAIECIHHAGTGIRSGFISTSQGVNFGDDSNDTGYDPSVSQMP